MRTTLSLSRLSLATVYLHGLVFAVLKNITVDDTFGDPETGQFITYLPADLWNLGTNCKTCTARPSRDMLFRQTWADTTYNPGSPVESASIVFNGTAAYVQCALARTKSGPPGNSDMSFFIDGQLAGTFVRDAPGNTGYDYNVTVFFTTDLPDGEHTLTIQNGHDGGQKVLLLLDAIIYSQDDGKPDISSTAPPGDPTSNDSSISSPSSVITSVIIAAVVGSIAGIILFILAFLIYRRCRRPPLHTLGPLLASEIWPPNHPHGEYSTLDSPPLHHPIVESRPPELPPPASQPQPKGKRLDPPAHPCLGGPGTISRGP